MTTYEAIELKIQLLESQPEGTYYISQYNVHRKDPEGWCTPGGYLEGFVSPRRIASAMYYIEQSTSPGQGWSLS